MQTQSRFTRWLAIAAVLTVALAGTPASGLALEPVDTNDTSLEGGERLVGFDSSIDLDLITAAGGTVRVTFPELRLVLAWAEDPVAFTAELLLDPGVDFVEENDPLRLTGATWDGATWDGSTWDAASWDAASWDGATWDAASWDGATWDGATWDAASWDGATWDGASWDGATWDGATWDAAAQDPGYAHQWGLGAANAPDAWTVTTGSGTVTVCVLDTGVDIDHPDLAAALWRDADGTVGYNAFAGTGDAVDDHGHGTHVAGILGAIGGNGLGVAGMARVKILPIKVMDASGGTEADLVAGLHFCVRQGASVASMSLHIDAHSPSVERAILYAQDNGLLAVAAAGNSGEPTIPYPAAYDGVLAVGAVTPNATLAGFSNHGPRLDLVAPGYRIASTLTDDRYAMGSGTSQAVPFVSATAALAWDVNPHLTAGDVASLLLGTTRDLGTPGPDDTYGHGALDAGAAVRAAAAP